MSTSSPSPTSDSPRNDPDGSFARRLIHHWFVEYNPLYLVSAACVLGGCFLLSRGLASNGSFAAMLGITLVGEIYGVSLVGGAALLTRLGQRRPAVILALLALLYQWDLTLHTETCAWWGPAGIGASAAWLAMFVIKLRALAWALRLRFDRQFLAAAILAGIGLAFGPRITAHFGAREAGALVAAWAFAIGTLHRSRGAIESIVELTPWGTTVLRRATRAAWIMSAVLVGLHVLYWRRDHGIDLAALLSVAPLLLVRHVRSEAGAWATVLATLVAVARFAPSAFFVTALIAGLALCLRAISPAFRVVVRPSPDVDRGPDQPYRTSGADGLEREPRAAIEAEAIVGRSERLRSLAGALFLFHASLWTSRWAGGPWPHHVAWLDAGLTVAVLLYAWRLRVRSPLAPLAAFYAHIVIQHRVLPPPRTAIEWGVTLVAGGFALLVGSLAVSYRLRASPAGEDAHRSP